ncbi:MAG: class I SAM-dependent methyltransferase [Acidobacteriota bacterium]
MPSRRWADHYSGGAAEYRRFRPSYSPELFEFLAGLVGSHELAWDCATGNGQAARGLSDFFRRVVATDASERQVVQGWVVQGWVRFVACRAEAVALRTGSVDFVAIAQALHWFANELFFSEVARVARRGAVIAAWTYAPMSVSEEVDRLMQRFRAEVVEPYWPPERVFVDDGYQSLPFPFAKVPAPAFTMRASWTLDQLLGYVGTWSAVKNLRAATGVDPVPELAAQLRPAWGPPDTRRAVSWPLRLRAGKV